MSEGPAKKHLKSRKVASVAALVLAALALLLSDITLYTKHALLDSKSFSTRAADSLKEDDVKSAIGRRLSDQIINSTDADLVSVQPVIEGVIAGVVSSKAFRELFEKAVEDVHRSLFKRDASTVTLTIANVGSLVKKAVDRVDPKLAKRVPNSMSSKLTSFSVGELTAQLNQVNDSISKWAVILLVASLLLYLLSVAIALRRRKALFWAGVTLAAVGLTYLVGYSVGRAVALNQISDQLYRDAASDVWRQFFHQLWVWNIVLCATGLLTVALATTALRPEAASRSLARARGVFTLSPRVNWAGGLQAIGLIAVGLLFIFFGEQMLQLAAAIGGLYLFYLGLSQLIGLIAWGKLPGRAWGATKRGLGHVLLELRRHGGSYLLAAVMIVGLIGVVEYTIQKRDIIDPDSIKVCNGHRVLCDRPLNEVVFPASHNSMSAANQPNWFFAQHHRGISNQLNDGIRGFLIDTHYGDQVGGRVRTDIDLRGGIAKQLGNELGDESVERAIQIRDRALFNAKENGRHAIFLCHALCELGATDFVKELSNIRAFLDRHRYEVLVIVIEDGVSPEDTEKAFKESGLIRYVYRGPAGPKWPTLRRMIARNQRVVVMAEKDRKGVPWYIQAYGPGAVTETPYHFESPKDFSCKKNRGSKKPSLFLLNHWIDTSPAPRVENAQKVNAYNFLLKRARQCQQERGMLPNLVAVDFYDVGDVTKVAKTLNGVK